VVNHRGEKGRGEIGGVYLPLSAGAYTTTLLLMIDRMKGGGPPHPAPVWAEFTIMMKCTSTSESGHCQSISTLSPVWLTDTSSDMVLYILIYFKKTGDGEEYIRNGGGLQKE
jgi:hypothetical protein